jgi:enterobactin synthetase component D
MVTIPRVLPAWISVVALYLEEVDTAAATAIELPPSYALASPDRQIAYRAGRYCAGLALEQLGLRGVRPGVDHDNAPAWPHGTVGSITHVMSLVAAAAAPRSKAVGIGIDIEPITSLDRAHALASRVATSSEVSSVMQAIMTDYSTAVALIVSSKHSLYKSLRAHAGRPFGYLDASIEDVQRSTGRFRARLKVDVSQTWVGGTIISGQYETAGDFVHTGIAIPT